RFGVDCAPLGPVVAPLVPRCALLPAPTPPLEDALRAILLPQLTFEGEDRRCGTRMHDSRRNICCRELCGGSPREGVRSEARAEQRLAAGGAAPPTRMKCASCFSGLQTPPTQSS